MVELEYWRLFASISATMIGLVFVGTFYYLESGWEGFDYFQTQLEALSVNYAKIIIAYFSTSLILSLIQEPFFPDLFSTIAFCGVFIAVSLSTRSLNKELGKFGSIHSDFNYHRHLSLNWGLVALVFVTPIIFFQGFELAAPTIEHFLLNDQTIGWIVFLSLVVGYWNLIGFLLTPFQFHKVERDKKQKENKKDIRNGNQPRNDPWDGDRVEFAENQIQERLEKNGFKYNPDFDIKESFETNEQLSADLAIPRLYYLPDVDDYGEATVSILLPDDWESDHDLLDRASVLAHVTGAITRSAYQDLTGVKIQVFRREMAPWETRPSNQMLLMVRWTGSDFDKLDSKHTGPEDILESASTYSLHRVLYPLGLKEYDFDPKEREPDEDEEYSFYDIEDKSNAVAKRYTSKVVFNKDISQDRIRELIPEIVQEIREADAERNEDARVRWGRDVADVVWLFMFDEARYPSEMGGLDHFDHYIGKAEWIDPELKDDFSPIPLKDPDEAIEEIRINWSN